MITKDNFRKIQARYENRMDRRTERLLKQGDTEHALISMFGSMMFTGLTSYVYNKAQKDNNDKGEK